MEVDPMIVQQVPDGELAFRRIMFFDISVTPFVQNPISLLLMKRSNVLGLYNGMFAIVLPQLEAWTHLDLRFSSAMTAWAMLLRYHFWSR